MNDIKKSEIKTIENQKWKFDHRENGYVILSLMSTEKEKVKWSMQLHAVDIEACLNYIFKYYRGRCGYLTYNDLMDD